ncbi:hypothetical protein RFI_34352, partial [Reticulomyxa filosa]
MPYKAFVSIENEMHKVTLVFLRLKRLKEKVIELINTTNSKTIDSIPNFKIADNNDQYITSNRELRIAFKMKSVFFYPFYSKFYNYYNDEKKYPENEKKDDIVKYKSLDTELDKDFSWNEANKKAHEMVNEMINNKQQGIVV